MKNKIIKIMGAGILALAALGASTKPSQEKVKLIITGGHETDPRDHGRPVVLIGNALGVKPEVFREAFSHVRPAPAGREPETEQVRKNKDALLSALSPLGVTNDRLDQVSNYYRYRPDSGRLWPTTPAVAYAIFSNGVFQNVTIQDSGSGYCSAPLVSVPGHPEINLKATVAFGKDLKKNGSISEIKEAQESKRPPRDTK